MLAACRARTVLFFLMVGTLSCRGGPAGDAMSKADLILHNGKVYTLDPQVPNGTAIAIREDRILRVGSDEEILRLSSEGTLELDLEGKTALPGLIDAHLHMESIGKWLEQVQLKGLTSPQAAAERVKEAAERTAPGAWILGRGWDQTLWEVPEFPTAAVLDAVSGDHPVALRRIDGHAVWVNSRAMVAAGIDADTPDPPGGRILRDSETGEPNGVFVDDAEALISDKIPPSTAEDKMRWLEMAGKELIASGITSAHDAGVSPSDIALYKQMADAGRLPLRVYAMLGDSNKNYEDYFLEPAVIDYGNHRFTFRSIKLGVDGALGSRGAALLAPYSDEPEYQGHLTMPLEELEKISREALEKGIQVCVHAIGDRGNRLALDALQRALETGPAEDPRFRIEHAQVLSPDDIPRFGALGIIAAVQPVHATDDMHMAPARLGKERLAGAYAWRSLLEASASLAFGSDAPFAHWNPWQGLQAAVTRQDRHGQPPEGWRPEQRLSREAALTGFTLGAAFAAFEEEKKGTLTPGKLADLVVMDRDYFEVPTTEIARLTPELTVLGGQVVYRRNLPPSR